MNIYNNIYNNEYIYDDKRKVVFLLALFINFILFFFPFLLLHGYCEHKPSKTAQLITDVSPLEWLQIIDFCSIFNEDDFLARFLS